MKLNSLNLVKKISQIERGLEFVEFEAPESLLSHGQKNKDGKYELKIIGKEQLNRDCFLLYLELPNT